jgi:hypothetical protein
MNARCESQFEAVESSTVAQQALGNAGSVARASVVNRTHRVVRERAQVMQARRSHGRGLMFPLILCSVLLILAAFALWSGLYQYQVSGAAEAVQTDVATLADANDHFMVMLLWFVPVSIVLLGTLLIRRTRHPASREIVR